MACGGGRPGTRVDTSRTNIPLEGPPLQLVPGAHAGKHVLLLISCPVVHSSQSGPDHAPAQMHLPEPVRPSLQTPCLQSGHWVHKVP